MAGSTPRRFEGSQAGKEGGTDKGILGDEGGREREANSTLIGEKTVSGPAKGSLN